MSLQLMTTILQANLVLPVLRDGMVMAWGGRGVSYRTAKIANKPGEQEGPI